MHVAAVGTQIEDRVADELSGAVVGDVAAATGFEDLDAARGELLGRRHDVSARRRQLDAERQDVRMLQQQQRVGDAVRAALLDERALQLDGLARRRRVRDDAREARASGCLYTCFGSKFSRMSLTCDQELVGHRAVDQPVVVAERQIAHRPDPDRVVDDHRRASRSRRRRGSPPAAG